MNSNQINRGRAAGTGGSAPSAYRAAGADRPAQTAGRAAASRTRAVGQTAPGRTQAQAAGRAATARGQSQAARQNAGAHPSSRPAPRVAGAGRPAQAPAFAGRGRFADPDRRYSALRWALLAALVVYTLLVVRSTTARDVDFGEIASAMASAPGVGALEAIDANGFQERLGIAPEDCEGWLLYGSGDIMNVSELMIAKASDERARERFESACAARVEAQLNVFRSYGVDQKDLLEHAILWQRGSYVFYGVSENVDAWESLFLSRIR